MLQSGFAHPNELLSSLPADQLDRLLPYMMPEVIPQGTVLMEAGDEVDFVYFPHSGMVSLLDVLADGRAIETETVGREGALGAMAGLGSPISLARVIVQVRIETSKIPVIMVTSDVKSADRNKAFDVGINEFLAKPFSEEDLRAAIEKHIRIF